MRINQFVATTSGLSRRAADTAIAATRVTVNGSIATLGQTINPSHDQIRLDGNLLAPLHQFRYVMLNKPTGYISSHARQGAAPTLYELLPTHLGLLRLVGRLDQDSSGLVLLTNDGSFIQRYAHPSNHKNKTYELILDKPLATSGASLLEQGIQLADGPSRVHVLAIHGHTIKVSLSEGRNRQLRRTFGALGYGIQRLHRLSIGPFQLGNLASGQWQEFSLGAGQ